MELAKVTALVTGANRGLGQALVEELLSRDAARVYAAARRLETLESVVALDAGRVTPIRLDLTDRESVESAARTAGDITLLVNNASTSVFSTPLEAEPAGLEEEMTTNYRGTYDVIPAFIPVLEGNGGGAIVNVLSLLALASTPPMTGYSASKAAAHSLTQALRPVLATRDVSVHGVYPAGIDTDMLAGIDMPKTPPADVAKGVLDGLAADLEDIFPDPNSQEMSAMWWSDPKSFERAFAAS